MTLAERALSAAPISFAELLSGRGGPVSGETTMTLKTYAREIVGSGFPGIRGRGDRGRRAQLDGYVRRIIDVDFAEQDRAVRRPAVLERWLAAYAAATATTASFETIRDATTAGHREKPAKTTTIPYRDVLERLWVVEPLPAWLPSSNRFSRLAQAPKHHLTDPALAARLLGLDEAALLAGRGPAAAIPHVGPLIGQLFDEERRTKGIAPDLRRQIRDTKHRSIVAKFETWCDDESLKVVDESPLAKAINYAKNQREALRTFLDDGRVPIDNNWSERELRRIAWGRDNWLFVGSEDGGRAAAHFISLIASCQLHGIEPLGYLRDLFCLLPWWPKSQVLVSWFSVNWSPVKRRIGTPSQRAAPWL
jgi:hypothetical protein